MQIKKNVLKAGIAGAIMLASAGIALAAPAAATTNVNVRSGPGTGYGVVDALRRGERVEVTGCRGGWCYVEKRGPDGWVSANYLRASSRGYGVKPGFSFEFNFGTPPIYQQPQRPQRPGHGGWDGRDRHDRWDRDDRWDRNGRDRDDRWGRDRDDRWPRRDRDWYRN
ncbi:MAG TPA: SH3 domain-containing protein [Devosia sp.]|jgi:uncharacterized protein YraI|nr:SH3 domain-containing protein [Devosia sp.]